MTAAGIAGRATTERSIQDVARLAGTTSRTLRHYGDLGLLSPSRIGSNGYRYYDDVALARLQRILLLRDLGLGLPAIAEVLDGAIERVDALETHLGWLRTERDLIDRRIRSVETTMNNLREGEATMAEQMFDGFDHTQYREEVEQRWGAESYATSDAWWRGMSESERSEWMSRQTQLAADWRAAAASGLAPDGPEAQALAARQAEWLGAIPGTLRVDGRPTKEYFLGLGEMYVADERFAANYGGVAGATFVRDAMAAYAERELD